MPNIIRQILTHHGYIMLYLLGAIGQPVKVSAMEATLNDGSWPLSNLAHVTLGLEGGALGHLQVN